MAQHTYLTTPEETAVLRVSATDTVEDPDVIRADIQETRERMSGTLDEIGDVLLQRKTEMQERLDVFSPVKENPLMAIGVGFGAGLALGLATGSDDEHAVRRLSPTVGAEERARYWESRARELMATARDEDVRPYTYRIPAGESYPEETSTFRASTKTIAEDTASWVGDLKQSVQEGFSGLLGACLRR